uniref:hypothetical protein n=1 Tax=Thaumasiovibrio occultus TaxID=1891184 RepID=UPI000B3642D1|nr:hypothetical protein [Thaumasiovibrio occultus]
MFSFFKRKPVLAGEDLQFQIETYQWLLKYFGGDDFYTHTQLVLPTDQYFPAQVSSPTEAVIATFSQVKHYAGMSDWPCNLRIQEADAETHLGHTLLIKEAPSTANGTYFKQDGEVNISFNPVLAKNPPRLVATFAHELGHYLTDSLPEPPPGGWDNWEFATDLTAVFLGFGIFSANTAFSFQQFTGSGTQGWSSQRSGYLSDTELLFGLAIFCHLKDIAPDDVAKFIKPALRKLFRRCYQQIARTEGLIADLRAVEYIGITTHKLPRFVAS